MAITVHPTVGIDRYTVCKLVQLADGSSIDVCAYGDTLAEAMAELRIKLDSEYAGLPAYNLLAMEPVREDQS